MPVNDLRQSCVAGVRAFLSSRAPERSWSLEFLCERGRIVSRNRHATFELWSEERQHADLDLRYGVQRMLPSPWRPRSAMVDAIEGVAPGEYGREALETAIAMRESHRRGARVELPPEHRSLRLG